MPSEKSPKYHVVPPGLETVDLFRPRPCIIDNQGRDITDQHPQPEWSAFPDALNEPTTALPMRRAARRAIIGTKQARDRLRLRAKMERRAALIAQRNQDNQERAQTRRTFKHARKRVEKLERKIVDAIEDGNDRAAREAQRTLLTSFHGKLMAFQRANNKLPQRHKLTGAQLIIEASRLNLFEREDEVVRIRYEAKNVKRSRLDHKFRVKDYRTIHSFGVRHRARQYLCKMALEPFLLRECADYQYGLKGSGGEDAIRAIMRGIETTESFYFVELDLQDFFGSIGKEKTPAHECSTQPLEDWLPLPTDITHTSILNTYYTTDYSRIPVDHILSQRMVSQRDLPQGSSVTPLIATYVMAQLLKDVEGDLIAGAFLISYMDNVGIYGSEPLAVYQAMQALKRACSRCRFGPLRLNPDYRLANAKAGFEYLGFSIRRITVDGKPAAEVGVSHNNTEKFVAEVRSRLKQAQLTSHLSDHAEQRAAHIQSLAKYLRGWLESYRIVPDIKAKAASLCDKAAKGLFQGHVLKQAFEIATQRHD